jgi:hypothetical protein
LHPLLSLLRTAVRFWLIVEGQLPIFSEKRRNAQEIAQNGARHVIFRIRIVVELMLDVRIVHRRI